MTNIKRLYSVQRYQHNVVLACLLFGLALLPRIFTLGKAFTTDEAYHWVGYRSETFLTAILHKNFADTIITGHPGVTTMWLGSAGLLLEQFLQSTGILSNPAFETHLTLMRLPLACTTAVLIVISWLLLQRFLDTPIATIAALFWISDPFLVAHSRVLHLDALLSLLMLVAILALLSACFDQHGPRLHVQKPMLLVAGVASGLALLTKSPALLLGPVGGLILLAWLWQRSTHPQATPAAPRHSVAQCTHAIALWLGITLLTVTVTWPALWVAPGPAISSVLNEATDNGGTPHKESFLLGTAYGYEDPGPWFYPLTLLGRMTPWAIAGLLMLPIAAYMRWKSSPPYALPLLLILGTAMLLIGILTMVPKKADRYALPSVPLAHMLAATGLYWSTHKLPALLRRAAALGIATVAAVTLLYFHPYYLAYYSPLIGGQEMAPRIVPVGWGEGLDKAAAWLNGQPDIAQSQIASWSFPTLQAYTATPVTWQGALDDGTINYLVVYIFQRQTGDGMPQVDQVIDHCAPVHTVSIHNIEYAWIYHVPRVQKHQTAGATFGNALRLEDYQVAAPDPCDCSPLQLTLTLQPLEQPQQPLFFFVHILNSDGQRVQQLDIPLENLVPTAYWRDTALLLHPLTIPLPATTPPGRYEVVAGVYNPATDVRLPIVPDAPLSPSEQSTDTLPLAMVEVTETFDQDCVHPGTSGR